MFASNLTCLHCLRPTTTGDVFKFLSIRKCPFNVKVAHLHSQSHFPVSLPSWRTSCGLRKEFLPLRFTKYMHSHVGVQCCFVSTISYFALQDQKGENFLSQSHFSICLLIVWPFTWFPGSVPSSFRQDLQIAWLCTIIMPPGSPVVLLCSIVMPPGSPGSVALRLHRHAARISG
jgi:hypothetical protein